MSDKTDAVVADEPADFDPADPTGANEAKAEAPEDSAEAQPEEEEQQDGGEDGQPDEDEEEAPDSSPEEEGKVPQSRIDEVTKQARTAEREREYWKQRALAQEKAEEGDKPSDGPALEKTLEDFEYDVAAYTKYVAEETTKHYESTAERQRQEQDLSRVMQEHIKRESEFAAKVEDYHQVALNENLAVTPLMADVIRRTDDGPAVLYHLGQNPEVSAQIAQLPPQLQLLELGKISSKIATASEPPKSATPPPAKTISGSKPARKISTTSPESDSLSDDEWLRRERARVEKLGRAY